MDAERLEDEHLWIHKYNTKNFYDIRREAEEINGEFLRQRSLRGLWFPSRIEEMPILSERIVRALAIRPIGVEDVCHIWELNYRDTMNTIPTDTPGNIKHRKELSLALSPFLARHDFTCALCCLGFANKTGLMSHLRNKCRLRHYPEHAALLHWAHQLARNELNIPEHLVNIFTEERARVGTAFTISEVTRTYSRLASSIGLLSLLLEDGRRDESRNNLQEMFGAAIRALSPTVPPGDEEIVSLTTEFLNLQVQYSVACDIGLQII